jgi:predicted NACHT family NTPase
MHIAHKYFEKGVYFISEDELIREINVYFSKLSNYNPETLDGEIVLRALESQHGFLVKRGLGIYSFLHLTFQEYFTALYMIENISSDSMANLLKKRLNDKRWDEIILMATSLLQTK